jgi:hypothetical protein
VEGAEVMIFTTRARLVFGILVVLIFSIGLGASRTLRRGNVRDCIVVGWHGQPMQAQDDRACALQRKARSSRPGHGRINKKSTIYLPLQVALSLFSYLQHLLGSSSTFLLVLIPLLVDSRPLSH